MTTRVAVLGLALAAMATFSRAEAGAAATVQGLRGEVARDKGDLGTKWKTERAELSRLRAERKAELAKVGGMPGTRADKTKARRVLEVRAADAGRPPAGCRPPQEPARGRPVQERPDPGSAPVLTGRRREQKRSPGPPGRRGPLSRAWNEAIGR